MFKGILSSRKSFDEQTNGWLEISEICNVVKEPDGNLKIEEPEGSLKPEAEEKPNVEEQDFGTDDDAETKRKQFRSMDRVIRKSLDMGSSFD